MSMNPGVVDNLTAIKWLKTRIVLARQKGEDPTPFENNLSEIRRQIAQEAEGKSEPEFPMSVLLERTGKAYTRGYQDGQEDLSIVTDFKIKQLESQLTEALKQVEREIAKVGKASPDCEVCAWEQQEKIDVLEQQIGALESEIQLGDTARELKNQRNKVEHLNFKIVKLLETGRLLKARWLKAESDKIEILQSGFARK